MLSAAVLLIFTIAVASARWQPFKDRQVVGVEGLSINRIDRHLPSAEQARIIEPFELQDHRIQARPPHRNASAACLEEFARISCRLAVSDARLTLSNF